MTRKLCFASDNASGAHPNILKAIEQANQGTAAAYGADPYTARVIEKMRTAFNADADIFFTFGGTGANVMALGSLARSFEAIFCSDCAHIWSDECSAPQKFIGCKIVPVRNTSGKITPDEIYASFGPHRGVHHALPRAVSITQPTELGSVYTLEEIQALSDFCKEHEMFLHVDGARFSNAAAALDVSLGSLSHEVGVDVLSFGGTKNGALGAEAVIYFNHDLLTHAEYARKQATQLASKMRFISAQFDALFTDQLWLDNAMHANNMAKILAQETVSCGIELCGVQQINALFPILAVPVIEKLQRDCEFYIWDEQKNIVRWMTSFNTTEEEVTEFARLIKQASVDYNASE